MSALPFRLDGKVVLITGSTTGLGHAMALGLGALGARVAMNYAHDAGRAEQAFAAYREAGGEGVLVRGSVVEEETVDRLVGEVERALGAVEVLILNATPPQPMAPLERADWADYQTLLDFFVKSPYLLARRVLPAMKARRTGRIVNIGTELLGRGVRHTSAYATAKAPQHG
ncbi:MAG TPA: SDR family NAD(P)-dependent oxidoreductase, partial [Myxococcota bacterium]|nr:SDR family NAD(P)-dependent oxidoreductase [Myxococcota bacterium]